MKKLIALALALVLVLGCTAALAENVTLVYAEVNPIDSLMGKTAVAFKEKVEELTGGSVTIDIQASGVLGAEADVLDTMIGGGDTIDIARTATFSLNNYGVQKVVLLSIPYTFTGNDHFWKFAASEQGAEILAEPEQIGLGVKGLFYVNEGFRHFFFTKEVAGIEDLKGTKLRVSSDPIMTGMVNGLSANPTVISFGELYTSLQSGVVDGAEQPIVNYQSNTFYEVAPYMLLDGHTLGCGEVIITEAAWNKLDADQQAAVMEASKYASDYNKNASVQAEADSRATMEAAGTKFIPVDDVTPWQEACAAVRDAYVTGMEDLYQAILDMAK